MLLGGTSWSLASPADESKRTKDVQGWLCKFENISQKHCFLEALRLQHSLRCLFLAYKTLSIDRKPLGTSNIMYTFNLGV